jgi:hypothetical protein
MSKAYYALLSLFLITVILFFSSNAWSKVDLVTLPQRDAVQLTIYNSADLTLVRDQRPLTLKKGVNNLQFSWAKTLIDPTSIDIEVKNESGKVSLAEVEYPPGIKEAAIWKVESEISGKVPTEITYFTSGLTWNAFYLATLNAKESSMQLEGYIRVTNKSGEDYEQAKTRVVVGQINLLDKIAELARREQAYGKPIDKARPEKPELEAKKDRLFRKAKDTLAVQEAGLAVKRPKEIKKEGLSEYFLYSIEGTESIKDGWSKRLPSFKASAVGVESLYKYEKKRYGNEVLRFLKFKNDQEHNLGETPLPGGKIQIFGQVNQGSGLRYVGSDKLKYIPLKQKVELNLGASDKVKVEPKVIKYQKENIVFDEDGDVNGFEEVKEFQLQVKNYRQKPVHLEIVRNMQNRFWEIKNIQNPGQYEQVDQDSVKYSLEVEAQSEEQIRYNLTSFHGATRRGR